jgi:hypothetical protein
MSYNSAFISSTQVAASTPFDNTIENGYVATNVQQALQDIRNFNILNPVYTTISASGTLTLTDTSLSYQFLTGSGTNYSTVLPNATTLFKGLTYTIFNTTNETIAIKNSSGTTLITLAQNSLGYIYLQDNSTTNGTWVLWQILLSSVASGIINYNLTSSTLFSTTSGTDVVLTGFSVTPQAGTYAVWYNCEFTSTQNSAINYFSVYNNGTQISESERGIAAPQSHPTTALASTLGIVTVNGSQAIDMRVRTNVGTLRVYDRTILLIRLGT